MSRMRVVENLRLGTRVIINAPERGACVGRIEDIRPVEEVPDLPGFEAAGRESREVMQVWGVTRYALISYSPAAGVELVFAALEIGGDWYDLRKALITLEVVGQYEHSRN